MTRRTYRYCADSGHPPCALPGCDQPALRRPDEKPNKFLRRVGWHIRWLPLPDFGDG